MQIIIDKIKDVDNHKIHFGTSRSRLSKNLAYFIEIVKTKTNDKVRHYCEKIEYDILLNEYQKVMKTDGRKSRKKG